MPAPDSDAACGEPTASSLTLNVAANCPADAGVNVTCMLQVPFGAKVDAQLFVCEKTPALAPAIEMLLTFNVAVPGFDRVRACGALAVPVF